MPELSIQELKADSMTFVSLVSCLVKDLEGEERRHKADLLIDELTTRVWKGIPGFSRREGEQPSPTDINILQVLASVVHHFPVACPL